MSTEHKTIHPGRPLKYPWDYWLTGDEVVLTKGKDFTCETYSLALQARRKARDMGVRVKVQICGPTITLSVKENGHA